MNSRILMRCALIIAPLLAAPGQAATRYVSTGGTDSGGCEQPRVFDDIFNDAFEAK